MPNWDYKYDLVNSFIHLYSISEQTLHILGKSVFRCKKKMKAAAVFLVFASLLIVHVQGKILNQMATQ